MAEFKIGCTSARKAVAWLSDHGPMDAVPTSGSYVV
jgi:hypothetical protein